MVDPFLVQEVPNVPVVSQWLSELTHSPVLPHEASEPSKPALDMEQLQKDQLQPAEPE